MSRALDVARKALQLLAPSSPSHGVDHTARVLRKALELARSVKGVDYDVLVVAALLHDIARDLPGDHAENSAEIAYHILVENGVDRGFAERVREAILCHSYQRVFVRGEQCRSLEGMVLSDADKVDACGAIGIARTFTFGGENRRGIDQSLKHLEDKIVNLASYAYTEEGRRTLERLSSRVKLFIAWLREELGSERETFLTKSELLQGPSSSPRSST